MSTYPATNAPPVVDPVEAMAYSVVVLTCIIISFAGLCFMCHHKYTTRRVADLGGPPPPETPEQRYVQPPPPPPPLVPPLHVAVISQPDGEYALGLRTRVDKKMSE